ncbi:uncharacterized protein VTP21DRAFT_5271 [Calcarisporiella thermophila]|uniref:uncharacterized protein n=1 Tax=Calcarisporiella thermophila TaxID=911321 RepID=UPI0037447054
MSEPNAYQTHPTPHPSSNVTPTPAEDHQYSASSDLEKSNLSANANTKRRCPACCYNPCPRCCGYCPVWLRWSSITCCILIILTAIVLAILFGTTFRQPEVKFLGLGPNPNGAQLYVVNGTRFSINVGLVMQVVNPNIAGAKFSMIKAQAKYPDPRDPSAPGFPAGGGNLTDVNIGSHSNTTFVFPFSVDYDPTIDQNKVMLRDIADRCGLLGSPKRPLQIKYDLTLFVHLLVATISPTIPLSTSLDCPIQNGQLPGIDSLPQR